MKQSNIAENVSKAALTALLFFTIMIQTVSTAQTPSAQGTNRPHVPGAPELPPSAQIFELLNMVPQGYKQTLQLGVPNVLNFQNMRLEIVSSQIVELDLTVDNEVTMHYLALDLKPSESLELTINIGVEAPAGVAAPLEGIDFYLTLNPGSAEPVIESTIKLYIDEETLEAATGREIVPWALSWAFWDGDEWETVKSWLDEEGYLVAKTDHFSTWTLVEVGRPAPLPDVPGLPSSAVAHDYSDTVPRGFTWRAREGEPTVLVFKDVTMMFSSNRGLGLSITTGLNVAGNVFSLELVSGEALDLNINMDSAPPSGVTEIANSISVYIEIEPSVTVAVDASLSLLIDEGEIEARLGRDTDATKLTWAYWRNGEWVPVESEIDENGYLKARTSHFSVWTIAEAPKVPLPTPVAPPDIPGIPKTALAYEFLETVPAGFAWKAEAGKSTVLSFKNFMLMVNPGKSLDLEITVGPDVAKQTFSLHLVPGESLSLKIDVTTSAPSGVEKASKDIGVYLEIEPGSAAAVEATLSLYIDEASLEARLGRTIDSTKLSWAYWDGGAWVLVESTLDANGFLNAETSHFSTWTVVEAVEEEPAAPGPTPPPSTTETLWLLYGGVLAIAVLAFAYVFHKRG